MSRLWSALDERSEAGHYLRAAGAVAFVAVINAEGVEGIGSAFHIGEGIFITARHVVDGVTVQEVATTKSAHLVEETGGQAMPPRRLTIIDGPHFGPDDLDVAVFRVDLGGAPLPALTLSAHTDYGLGENDLVLSDILVVGYPPIPFTTIPCQVATLGQINAVVRVRHSSALHFIASATARGGFSGGPVLDVSGTAVALVTESLGRGGEPVETGYMSLLSIDPGVDLAARTYGFSLNGGFPGRYSDTLFAAGFSNPAGRSLNSLIYDASLYIYDDDRDLFVEINCADAALLASAVQAFEAVTPLNRVDVVDGSVLYLPTENPSAALLMTAAEAAVSVFDEAGYRQMAIERSQWQLKL
jgi:hypothetical protein